MTVTWPGLPSSSSHAAALVDAEAGCLVHNTHSDVICMLAGIAVLRPCGDGISAP